MGKMRRVALALVPALLLVAGCTNGGTTPASSASALAATATPTVSEALVVMDPPDGAVDIAPDATITVRAEQGTLEKVVLSGGASIPGTLSPDRTSWTATGLFAGTRYVLSARAEDRHGLSTLQTTSFKTVVPTATAKVKMAPVQDETVGIGMPIMLTLTEPTADRAAVERRLTVESSAPVTGSWYWLSDTSLHYRPQTYWPANTAITVRMSLRGVPFGNGVYGEQDRVVSFRTGDAMISTVDVAGHQMTVTQNGQPLRTIPVTTGKAGPSDPRRNQDHQREVRRQAHGRGDDRRRLHRSRLLRRRRQVRDASDQQRGVRARGAVVGGLAGQRQRQPRVHRHEHRERPLVVRHQSTRRRRASTSTPIDRSNPATASPTGTCHGISGCRAQRCSGGGAVRRQLSERARLEVRAAFGQLARA